MDVEVRVGGQGTVVGDVATPATGVAARCDICGDSGEAVASLSEEGVGGPFACTDCLRARIEAISIARWRFKSATGLPWGKITS